MGVLLHFYFRLSIAPTIALRIQSDKVRWSKRAEAFIFRSKSGDTLKATTIVLVFFIAVYIVNISSATSRIFLRIIGNEILDSPRPENAPDVV